MKVMAKVLGAGVAAYAALFSVYYFNLDMKLMKYVVVPLLEKHYDSVKREHLI